MARRCRRRRTRTRCLTTSRSRERSSRRRRQSMRSRMSATGTRVVTSCHRSSRPPTGGAGGCVRAKRQLDRERAQEERPVPRSRQKRLKEAKRQLDEELAVECRANAEYEHYRVHGRDSSGRRLGARPQPYDSPQTPAGTINLTDPDSRLLKAPRGFVQGYNAQVVTNEKQIVIAAEINTDSPDFGHLEPMIEAAERELAVAGVTETPGI